MPLRLEATAGACSDAIEVQTTATDSSANSHSFTLPVTVFPPLAPSIELSGGRLIAHVSGGDGVPLYLTWTVGPERFARQSIVAPASGSVTLSVVDGTGTIATVTADVVNGALDNVQTSQYEQPSLAAGPATNGC
jgi:hypothetical protein